MGISRTKKTGIILERELSTDEVFNELVYCVNKNKHLKNENEQLKQTISNYEKTIDKVFNNIVFADKNAIQSLKKQLKEELKE